MAVALLGASALALQHKEHATSLLGKSQQDVRAALLWDALPCVSAGMFLIFYGELCFRSKNLLHRSNWRDLGMYVTKAGFIAACTYMVMYRCHQECHPRTFLGFEQHFYRVRWYLRLFASAAAAQGILASAVVGTFGLLFQPEEGAPDAAPPTKLLGAIPDSIVDAMGLNGKLLSMRRGAAAALVAVLNGGIMPLLLVYGLWALWLPHLPLLQRLRAPLTWSSNVKTEL